MNTLGALATQRTHTQADTECAQTHSSAKKEQRSFTYLAGEIWKNGSLAFAF